MRKRILILDDDPAVMEILQVLLDIDGFDSVLVLQTDDLLELVRLHQPSLIILDFWLRKVNGGEWCIKLKNDPELMAIPVIIYTAGCSSGFGKGTYGCDDFIAKPFDISDMMARVKRLTKISHPVPKKHSGNPPPQPNMVRLSDRY